METKRPVEYLNELLEKNGASIPSPLMNEIIKQMVLFARDYSTLVTNVESKSFDEAEKIIFGVELIPKTDK